MNVTFSNMSISCDLIRHILLLEADGSTCMRDCNLTIFSIRNIQSFSLSCTNVLKNMFFLFEILEKFNRTELIFFSKNILCWQRPLLFTIHTKFQLRDDLYLSLCRWSTLVRFVYYVLFYIHVQSITGLKIRSEVNHLSYFPECGQLRIFFQTMLQNTRTLLDTGYSKIVCTFIQNYHAGSSIHKLAHTHTDNLVTAFRNIA